MLVATQEQQFYFNWSAVDLWEELQGSGCRESIHLDMPCHNQSWHLKKLQEIWAEAGEVLTSRKRSLGRKNQQLLDPINASLQGERPEELPGHGGRTLCPGEGQSGCSQDATAQMWAGELVPVPRPWSTTTAGADLSTTGLTQWCSQVSEMDRSLFQDVGVNSKEGKLPMLMSLSNTLQLSIL